MIAAAIHMKAYLSIVSLHRPQMPQITLIPHQHDDNVGVCMVPELLQPPLHILKSHCSRQLCFCLEDFLAGRCASDPFGHLFRKCIIHINLSHM